MAFIIQVEHPKSNGDHYIWGFSEERQIVLMCDSPTIAKRFNTEMAAKTYIGVYSLDPVYRFPKSPKIVEIP